MMIRISTALAALVLATSAPAAIIDFSAQDGAYDRFARTFSEDGYRISYTPTSDFGFALIDDPADHLGLCGPGCASNGTTAFYSFNEGSITFDLKGGRLFSLASMDVAQTWLGDDRPLTLTLTGIKADGIVTKTIFVDAAGAESFSSFAFSEFDGVSSLTIAGGQDFPEFAIDNLDLTAAAVPELACWAMMVTGFGVVGHALRRRPPAVRPA